MSQPYIGQIIAVGFNFVPQNYQACDGSLLSISDNDVLFTLLGTTYGGDGVNTFGVPDLRGRTPLHSGTGTGLSTYSLGQTGGSESVTLTSNQLPAHTHSLLASDSVASSSPSGQFFGAPTTRNLYTGTAATSTMGDIVDPAGSSQPHENRQPFQVINYVIAIYGIYPSPS